MGIENLIANSIQPSGIITPFQLQAGQDELNQNKLIGARRQQEMQIQAEREKRLKISEDLKNIVEQGEYVANVVKNSRPETWENTVQSLEQRLGKSIPNLHFQWDAQKIQDVVNEGMSNVEAVKKAYQQVSTTAGIGNYDPNSGTISVIKDEKGNPFMAPNASPELQGNIQRNREMWKGTDVIDPHGSKYRTTQQDANPQAFGGGSDNVAPQSFTGGITNPGNMRPQGASTGFQRFDSPEAGLQAMNDNLSAYGKKGINTLAGVISRWSPPNENDTAGLIASASKRLNLDPNQPIDLSNPLVRNAISTAIMIQEHGSKKLFGGAQGGPIKGPTLQEQEAVKTDALRANEAIKNQAEVDKALPEKQKGIAMFNTILDDLESKYKELDAQGGITSPDKGLLSNMGAGINSSDTGQWMQNMTGSKQQSLRNSIMSARPLLLQAIMKATGMNAKQMDSERELQNMMKAATDPQADIKSVLGQIQLVRQLYGGGGGSDIKPSTSGQRSWEELDKLYGGQ